MGSQDKIQRTLLPIPDQPRVGLTVVGDNRTTGNRTDAMKRAMRSRREFLEHFPQIDRSRE